MSSKQKQAETNIQTFLRIKPSLGKKASGFFAQDELEKSSLVFNLPSNFKASDYVNNSKLHHSFHFNGIIDANASQDDVFKKVGVAAVQNAIEGFNSTIFAYGQTGSGKTFTLTGGPEKYSDRGIIPRAISMLYNEARTRTDVQFKAYISYLELYNEQGYDLLDPSHETKALEDLPKVVMLEDEHGNFHLKNLSMHPAESEEEALNLLFLGDTNRAIAETPMNMASSRSHCIFTISLECRVVGSDKVRRSKLHLVDLAGSERVAKTNSSGSILNEARHINSSLFYLEMVIVALYEQATKGRTHIPYRNCMMTSVLRDSLGGNCKTIMIATINPEADHTEESLSTCKFAQRVSLIKNKALLNEETDPSVIIRRLKDELLNLREEIAFLKGEAGEGTVLSPLELESLKTQCRDYCYDLDPHSTLNIGAMTLTKIKDVFAIMKNLVLENKAAAGSGGADKQALPASEEAAQLIKQVNDLKSLLLQRDSEIAILVNMVKKGKTVEDVGYAQQRTSRGTDRSQSANHNFNDEDSDAGSTGHGNLGNGSQSTAQQRQIQAQQQAAQARQQRSFQEQQQLAQMQREKENQERLIKRHLFGVPPPADRNIFDDAQESFEWFRQHCSLNPPMEQNKAELKEKITEAKLMGDRANQSRSRINYLKGSIEDIRRERVLRRLNDTKETGEEPQEEEVETEAETTHRRAIDEEKAVYKESFEKLRVLKPEIEHIGKMIEKARVTMQSQFDQWYANLHARNGIIGSSQASAHGSAYASSTLGSTAGSSAGSVAPSTQVGNNLSMSMMSSDTRDTREDRRVPPLGLGMDSKLTSTSGGRQAAHHSASVSGGNASMLSADSKVADDDVNEDIQAFYQAKEELLRRRGAKN